VGSNPDKNLKAIFDPGLPQKIQQIFPAILKSVPLMIYFARHSIKILKKGSLRHTYMATFRRIQPHFTCLAPVITWQT